MAWKPWRIDETKQYANPKKVMQAYADVLEDCMGGDFAGKLVIVPDSKGVDSYDVVAEVGKDGILAILMSFSFDSPTFNKGTVLFYCLPAKIEEPIYFKGEISHLVSSVNKITARSEKIMDTLRYLSRLSNYHNKLLSL